MKNGDSDRQIDTPPEQKGGCNMTLKEALRIFPMTDGIKNLIVCGNGTKKEHYIDSRTTQDGDFNYTVFPLADNSFKYCFVCPNCQRIHVRDKRLLIPDDSGMPMNKAPFFPIPEDELPAEFILEQKAHSETNNNIITIQDPEKMTVYRPSVNLLIQELHNITLVQRNKKLTESLDMLVNNDHPEYWDKDVDEC